MTYRKGLNMAAGLILLSGLAMSTPSAAAALSCVGGSVYFDGVIQQPATHPQGTAASIQAYNPALCSGGSNAFSATWIALQGTASSGY